MSGPQALTLRDRETDPFAERRRTVSTSQIARVQITVSKVSSLNESR